MICIPGRVPQPAKEVDLVGEMEKGKKGGGMLCRPVAVGVPETCMLRKIETVCNPHLAASLHAFTLGWPLAIRSQRKCCLTVCPPDRIWHEIWSHLGRWPASEQA
jgi:hypothetical protein